MGTHYGEVERKEEGGNAHKSLIYFQKLELIITGNFC
jgi:hypothetical protein